MPNRLANEKSPYLLQHKDNPVDWRPWGEEAFAAAKELDRPILLSIGYSTCHWCHVMERESFSDKAVAKEMNANFVCVKLDREERPDVDKVYMTAVQAITGRGGWPLNVFLTPDLKPFYGGTYFPPTSRWGQPGWTDLLGRVAELWRDQRKAIEVDAGVLAESVAEAVAAKSAERARPAEAALTNATAVFSAAFDPENAGFGGAPKFPMPSYQRFLLHRAARGDDEARRLAVETLRAMGRGGIFDQVGGGFHRYSTDAQWRVPHFEKMLYDNAQLVENLADAVAVTRDAELSRLLARTIAYLKKDLSGPGGGFLSAEDADSLPPELAGTGSNDSHADKTEGAFYLWSEKDLKARLGADAPAFIARHGVLPGGNAPADPHGEFLGKNILYDKDPGAMPEPAADAARARLRAHRAKRPRPSRDDKALASWNGLALSGLSRAHAATGDPTPLAMAQACADFLRHRLTTDEGKTLWHRWRDGARAVPGLADDYAFVAQGLFDLYEAGFDPRHLAWSLTLAREAVRRFGAAGGGLFQTAEGDAKELFARAVEDHDGVEPAPSSVLADACLRLDALVGDAGLRRFADETLERFGPRLTERPLALPYLLGALDRALGAPKTVVIAGTDLPGGKELLAALRGTFRPDLIAAGYRAKGGKVKAELAALLPWIAAIPESPRAAAFVCVDRACGLPIADPAELTRRLDEK